MDPFTIASSFLGGGKGMPGFSSTSSASSGPQLTPWNQGDFVVSWGAGNATSGNRTAPAPVGGVSSDGTVFSTGAAASGLSGTSLMVAGVIIIGALLWKLSR